MDLGSPLPSIGKAAMAALVLLHLWHIFMTLMVVTLSPRNLEDDALPAYAAAFSWWAVAAFLALLFLIVEIICRAITVPGRNLRLLSVDAIALAGMAVMMIGCVQWSNAYSSMHWDRAHSWIPEHRVRGEFSYPSSLVPGSTANSEWKEFQEWLDFAPAVSTTVQLSLGDGRPVRDLSQCMPDLWRARSEEVRFVVGGGTEHRLRRPPSYPRLQELLLLPEEGGVGDVRLIQVLEVERFLGQIASEEDIPGEQRVRQLEAGELDEIIRSADRYDPVAVLVARAAPLSQLDAQLRELEDRGAEAFALYFYGP